jgi:hypothetical protein
MDEAWLVALIAYMVNVSVLLTLVRFAKRDPSRHQPGGEIRRMDGDAPSGRLVRAELPREAKARYPDYRGPHGFVRFRSSYPVDKYLARRRARTVFTAVVVTVGLVLTLRAVRQQQAGRPRR